MLSAFFSGSTPEHIWTAAALNTMGLSLTRKKGIELAGPVERMQIIATADMLAADEDLREGIAAGLRDHFLAQVRLAGGIVLGKVLLRFSFIVLIGAVFAALGYTLLVNASDSFQALIQSIAAGALLVVVINEMIPIAVRNVKAWAGIIGAAGFVFSAGLTWAAGG